MQFSKGYLLLLSWLIRNHTVKQKLNQGYEVMEEWKMMFLIHRVSRPSIVTRWGDTDYFDKPKGIMKCPCFTITDFIKILL